MDLAETEGLAVRIAPIVERIPAGNWTSYSEVAIVVGSHPVAVGTAVANNPIAGAWRVLTWDGKPSAQFRWNDPDRTEPPTDFLAAEGIRFDESGRADPAQQLDARALADAIGLDIDDAVSMLSQHLITRPVFDALFDSFVPSLPAVVRSQAPALKAKALGLKNTGYKNPEGLTEAGHTTTARDLATLATRLMHDFPEYVHYYTIKKYRYPGTPASNDSNRNLLLFRDPTVDGAVGLGQVHLGATALSLLRRR